MELKDDGRAGWESEEECKEGEIGSLEKNLVLKEKKMIERERAEWERDEWETTW